MSDSKKSMFSGMPAALDLEMSAGELVAALLGLGEGRRLHLLDSGGARPPDARFLIAGFDPFEVIEAYGRVARLARRRRRTSERLGSRCSDERLSKLARPDQIRAPPHAALGRHALYESRGGSRRRANKESQTPGEPEPKQCSTSSTCWSSTLRARPRRDRRSRRLGRRLGGARFALRRVPGRA